MEAFVQLWCEHAGIVRAGPECRKYGDPYQYALAFHIVDGCAIFEGMCSPIPWGVLRLVRIKVEALGLQIEWYRRKGDQTRKVTAMANSKHFDKSITELSGAALHQRLVDVAALIAKKEVTVDVIHHSEVEIAPGKWRHVSVADYTEK